MISKVFKRYIVMLFVGIAAIAAADELRASSIANIDTVWTNQITPNPHKTPVNSLRCTASDPIDTLDTAHEYIKIILYGDNTWHYYKMPEYQKVTDVYGSNWLNYGQDPYGIALADLPDQWSIWCVDSLDQFCCPHKTTVYSKFGMRRGRKHQGVDLPLKVGTPLQVRCAFLRSGEHMDRLLSSAMKMVLRLCMHTFQRDSCLRISGSMLVM